MNVDKIIFQNIISEYYQMVYQYLSTANICHFHYICKCFYSIYRSKQLIKNLSVVNLHHD